jgi:hypothetical protein
MANISRNFVAGKMNKAVDERLIPNGEYIDALNCRLGSSEESEIGAIENSKGNLPLTSLLYPPTGTLLSASAKCIGAYQDGANETLYWFVHDPNFSEGATGKLDLIVSFNTETNTLTYHVVSIDDLSGVNTTLNFNPQYLITGVNLVDSNEEGLLFWTDDYNQPRCINIRRTYAQPSGFIDGFFNEDILVIKRPPIEPILVQPLTTGGQQNFLEERFLCFAYRYRYADGEYSATSQFTAPVFVPNPFEFSINSFLNEGMVNLVNSVQLSFWTGGSLVKGIDLLFKEAGSNTIKVIEKIDKAISGVADGTYYPYIFTNSKIFTVLPESELLRLYDNVPLLAKAQTIMGNRLVYGNYVEGYNLIDKFDNPLRLTYISSLVSNEINNDQLIDDTDSGIYTINGSQTIPQATFTVDLDSVAGELNAGAQLNIAIRVTHALFTGSTPVPTEQTQSVQIDWSFTLLNSYASVYEMATSVEFIEAVGTAANIKPVYDPTPGNPTSCDGFTLTDIFNCALPNTLNGSTPVTKYASGISAPGQPFVIVTSPSSNVIGFQVPAMNYVGDLNNPTTFSVYEYYNVSYGEAFWSGIATPKSLHSNRGYEVGIVYMDEYLRASTALVSTDNAVHVPCEYCDRQNQIRITIPTTQRAPYWATSYKFVIKADRENYETVYASIFFRDPNTNNVYILLEGENSRKVETGDRLIVKADTAGPAKNCLYTTVLEKESKQRGFLEIPSSLDPNVNLEVPSGVYMKINPSNLTLVQDELSYITASDEDIASGAGSYPKASVLVNRYDTATSAYVDYDIPAGSRIIFNFEFERRGSGDGNNACEKRIYTLNKTLIASANYNNFKDWFDGDNVEIVLNQGIQDVGAGGCDIGNVYFPSLATAYPAISGDYCDNRYRFLRSTNNSLYLVATGTRACGTSQNKKSKVSLKIEVFRAENTLIFETEPQDTLPDVFYENNLFLSIGPDGEHYGNIQNQDFALNQSAIIDTEFFNCFAYGNGAESYKIRDSIVGKSFNLGNRVTSVSTQDYTQADRFGDLTYSGIYNDESNLNRLNEFNLGLLNFKQLEDSFGPITLIDGRETDILVLQEDKISYVLAGKNLLSDSAAGGAITSVPEVLGTQIARIENFGNSFHPESYAKWGEDKFFTDAKRGAVIQLKGDSYSNERLGVISEAGMRPWFRDLFIESLTTQKLGGYDPYMTEYVLTNNDIPIPMPEECIGCGIQQTFTFTAVTPITYCIDVGTLVGPFDVIWNPESINPGDGFIIQVTYDGSTTSSGVESTAGSLTIQKNSISPTIAYIELIPIGTEITLRVEVACPVPSPLTIVEIVISNDADGGKYTHAEYKYTDTPYISPTTSRLVQLSSGTANPLVSFYNEVSGNQGSGSFPLNGTTVSMISNKIGFDDFDFDPAFNKFMWFRSDNYYDSDPPNIATLLSLANTATPILGASPTYMADFTMPTSSEQYLYLIWNLRKPVETELCYSDVDVFDACCGCEQCAELCSYYDIYSSTGGSYQYTDCFSSEIVETDIGIDESISVCSSTIPIVLTGTVDVTFNQCGCPT